MKKRSKKEKEGVGWCSWRCVCVFSMGFYTCGEIEATVQIHVLWLAVDQEGFPHSPLPIPMYYLLYFGDEVYLGETKRNLTVRLSKHQ